jgi:hypothetical protein
VLKFYDEFSAGAPDELALSPLWEPCPDGTKAVVHPICFSGPANVGEQILQPLRTLLHGSLIKFRSCPPRPYKASLRTSIHGLRNYWKMAYLKDLSKDAIGVMTELYSRVPAPYTHIVIYTLGGALSRVPASETAVAYRDARHAVIAIGM